MNFLVFKISTIGTFLNNTSHTHTQQQKIRYSINSAFLERYRQTCKSVFLLRIQRIYYHRYGLRTVMRRFGIDTLSLVKLLQLLLLDRANCVIFFFFTLTFRVNCLLLFSKYTPPIPIPKYMQS